MVDLNVKLKSKERENFFSPDLEVGALKLLISLMNYEITFGPVNTWSV